MVNDTAKHIFLSYATEDKVLARLIKKNIESVFSKAKNQVFLADDSDSINLGDDWWDVIIKNLRNCSIVLLLATPISIAKQWPLFETGFSKALDTPIVPMCAYRLYRQDLELPLSSKQSMELTNPEEIKMLFERIATACDYPKPNPVALSVNCNEIIKAASKEEPQTKGIILAAGESFRWRASISKRHDVGNHNYYWDTLNSILKEEHKLKKPPLKTGLHKSLAPVNDSEVIYRSIRSLKEHGINDITVNISKGSRIIEQYIKKINASNPINIPRIQIYEPYLQKTGQVAQSAYQALLKQYNESTSTETFILCYSDIIWERRLLDELLRYKEADIAILVDESWQDNYPPERIWHNKLNAEIIFHTQGEIMMVGEAINRYDISPKFDLFSYGVNDEINDIFIDQCSEIVGLFKFNRKGCLAFIDEYGKRKNSGEAIQFYEWPELDNINITRKLPELELDNAQLGDFIEQLVRSRKDDIKIKLVIVKGGWQEIDHWGDYDRAVKRLAPSHQYPLHLN